MIIASKRYTFEITAESKDDEELNLAGMDSFHILHFNEEKGCYWAINNYGFICGPATVYRPEGDVVEKSCY